MSQIKKKNLSYRNINTDTVCRVQNSDGHFWFAIVSFVLLLLKVEHSLQVLSPPNLGDRGESRETPATLPHKASAAGQICGPCRSQKLKSLPAHQAGKQAFAREWPAPHNPETRSVKDSHND